MTVAAAGDGIPPLPGGGLGTHQGFLNTFLSLPTSQPLPPPAGIYLLSHPQVPLSPSCWPPPTGLLGSSKRSPQPEASPKLELRRQRGTNSPHLLFPNTLSLRSGLSESPPLPGRSCRALQLPQEYPVPEVPTTTPGGRPCFYFPADSGCSLLAAACPELLVGGKHVKPRDLLCHTVRPSGAYEPQKQGGEGGGHMALITMTMVLKNNPPRSWITTLCQAPG